MTDILVVFTGGTIGSRRSGNVMDVDPEAGYELLQLYASDASARPGIHLETVQPYQTLSENMNPGHWHALIGCLREAIEGLTGEAGAASGAMGRCRYRGIIVTHGSDTLPYTAALLGYALADSPVPIVLVAANHPLGDPRSNGLRNFAAAVDFIETAELPGVYAAFEHPIGGMMVYLGTRMMEASPFTDRFEPPYAAPLGHMAGGRFMPLAHEVNPPLAALRAPREPGLPPERLGFSTDVLYIRPYPGLDYRLYDFGAAARKPAAVLHGLYHSATAGSAEADGYAASIASFAAHCAAHGVDLYTAPAKAPSAAQYRSAADIAASGGVRGLPYIAPEAALAKLMAAYGTFPGEAGRAAREAFLTRNVFFEYHEGGSW